MNDAERAAYEGFWDRVSIETTKKSYYAEAEAKLSATEAKLSTTEAKLSTTEAKLSTTEAKLGAAVAERDAAVEKLRQSVRQMKADGMAVETITKFTGLTAAEISAL